MTQNAINSPVTLLQRVSISTSALVTCSTIIPADDTIPQITEGTQVLSLAITPKSATSTLFIEFASPCSCDATATLSPIVALFQDSTANALEAHYLALTNSRSSELFIRHIMTSGTTSSTTFQIRVGPSAGNCYVNGSVTGTRLEGGVSNTNLTISEYA